MSGDGEEIDTIDLFAVPDGGPLGPADIGARLIHDMPEFSHLRDGEARVEYLLRVKPRIRGGRLMIGEAMRPNFQGGAKMLCDWLLAKMFAGTPDFIVLLDLNWWLDATARDREILVFHELSHCVQKTGRDGDPKFDEAGNPVWALIGHDIEEFNAVVRRYGAWSRDVVDFVASVNAAP
ncbi:MAG: hypothetical protein GC191_08990 [Azospirillum sp.]|nr:hypothetical protein [Azospirillum sp.]